MFLIFAVLVPGACLRDWHGGLSADAGVDELFQTIKAADVAPHGEGEAKVAESCKLASGSCPIQSFTHGDFVDVYPGGETVCLDGSEYRFTVRLGDPEKLAIYFQGGGGCWDQVSFDAGVCRKHVHPTLTTTGAFDVKHPLNPWGNYSFVLINYCSGDVLSGNTTKNWGEKHGGQPNKVRGFYNTQSAIHYAAENFPKLKKLTLIGSSAGSIGLQLWSRHVLETLSKRSDDTTVIADSFLGVVYPITEEHAALSYLLKDFNICNSVLLNGAELQKCKDNYLLASDVFADAMAKFPTVRFAATSSKWDVVQIAFEKALELTRGHEAGAAMTTAQFYRVASQILERWMRQPNFHSYLVQSAVHTYLPFGYLYTANPERATPAHDGIGPGLIQWLTRLVDPPVDELRTVCWGPVRGFFEHEDVGDAPVLDNYCTEELAGYRNSTPSK